MEREIKESLMEPLDESQARSASGTGEEHNSEIPDIVIRRLPIYARSLQYLSSEGIDTVSSGDLGARLGVSAAQIRRDLSYFGEFGKQGKGYNVDYLLEQIGAILGLNREWSVALVGVGHLGRALLHYDVFSTQGFCFKALFDHNPEKIGHRIADLQVYGMDDMPEVIKSENIKMAIMAVPADGAQQAANALVESGVKAILNYAPIIVQVPPHVKIRHIDPVIALQSMTYYLTESEMQENGGVTERSRRNGLRLGNL